MSIFEYNGSALIAMVDFAIASDRRLGVQLQTIATDFRECIESTIDFSSASLVSPPMLPVWSILLSCSVCQPVIAGLGYEDKPFISTMDSIGAKELAKDFVVAGTTSESLYGDYKAKFKPEMEFFETVSQALLSSVHRDCLSGWRGHVYVVTPTEEGEDLEGQNGLT